MKYYKVFENNDIIEINKNDAEKFIIDVLESYDDILQLYPFNNIDTENYDMIEKCFIDAEKICIDYFNENNYFSCGSYTICKGKEIDDSIKHYENNDVFTALYTAKS